MTATAVAATIATARVVFDGQSLPIVPNPNNFPQKVMTQNFQGVPYSNICIGGAAFTQLVQLRTDRVDPWPTRSAYTVYLVCEGTTDIALGASGASVYASMWAYTDYARGVGYDWIIATTISPSTTFTGPQETQRLAANAAILADASSKFDAKVDLTADARLNNPADTTYFSNGLHFTDAGAQVAADLVKPAIAAVLTLNR